MSPLEEYQEKIGEPIALMEIMGNEIFYKKFHGDPNLVYIYCLEHNKTWEEVLEFKFDPNVTY